MEEGGSKAHGENDISHFLTEDSPFMKPEFVLDDHHEHTSIDPIRKAKLFELQHRLIQEANERFASRNAHTAPPCAPPLRPPSDCSRSPSPFIKPPKVIKHEEDDSLYVKVEDLPEDVCEQVRAMAAEGGTIGVCANNNTDPPRKLPFSEPTRLSAQPTMEEIQMCFAQVDLAILMETKPTKKNARATLRSASATAVPAGSGRFAAMAARRREKRVTAPRSQEGTPLPMPPQQAHYAESDQSESDNSSSTPIFKANQNPKPFALNANLANAQPPSRMQQLLIDLANSRRNSAAAAAAIINSNEKDNEANAVKSTGGKPDPESATPAQPWPPFAVSSDRSRRSSEQIQQNFSFLRDDFVRKLEQIQALAAAGPANIEDMNVRAASDGSKRAYQMPVWTHGGSSGGGSAGGSRVRYRTSWSGRSQEEYEVLDPLVRGAGRHTMT